MDTPFLAQTLIEHEYRLLKTALSNFLKREPAQEDWGKCSKISKVYEPFTYILAYEGDILGEVREERTDNTITIIFTQSNVLTALPEEK